jgi:HNH endonuclease
MAKSQLPCPTVVRLLLSYEPLTGKLFWKPRATCFFADGKYPKEREAKRWNSVWAGRPALDCDKGRGWLAGGIFARCCRAHRAAWVIVHGEWPKGEIDHINRVRSDNRLSNLRVVSHAENCQNRSRIKA